MNNKEKINDLGDIRKIINLEHYFQVLISIEEKPDLFNEYINIVNESLEQGIIKPTDLIFLRTNKPMDMLLNLDKYLEGKREVSKDEIINKIIVFSHLKDIESIKANFNQDNFEIIVDKKLTKK